MHDETIFSFAIPGTKLEIRSANSWWKSLISGLTTLKTHSFGVAYGVGERPWCCWWLMTAQCFWRVFHISADMCFFFLFFPLLQANTWPCRYVPVSMVPPPHCYPLYIHSLPYIFYSIYETYHKITGGSPWNAAMILQKGTFTRIQAHQPFAHLSARISSRNHALTWNRTGDVPFKNTSPTKERFHRLLFFFAYII